MQGSERFFSMYPYFRAAYLMLRGRSMPKIGVYDTHVSHHRAWPWDTDAFGELNNGRILTLFELGRWQATVRMGFMGVIIRERLMLPVAGVSVRYRKRVPIFQKYRMQTRFLGFDDRFVYAEQSMWQGDTCNHHLLLRAAVKSRQGTINPKDFAAMIRVDQTSPELPDWANAWIEADKTRPWPPESGPIHN